MYKRTAEGFMKQLTESKAWTIDTVWQKSGNEYLVSWQKWHFRTTDEELKAAAIEFYSSRNMAQAIEYKRDGTLIFHWRLQWIHKDEFHDPPEINEIYRPKRR